MIREYIREQDVVVEARNYLAKSANPLYQTYVQNLLRSAPMAVFLGQMPIRSKRALSLIFA